MKLLIAGLGLIGGSLAKAVKEKTDHSVFGLDQDPKVLEKALKEGAVDAGFSDRVLAEVDLILIALYPGAAMDFVRQHRQSFPDGCLIVDLCGVKRRVFSEIMALLQDRDVTYIGGHPMAGREQFGFDGALPGLFDGAFMILTPPDTLPEEQLKRAEDFFLEIGFGAVTLTTPAHHDEVIALTSQLAHVVSSAYVQSPLAGEYMGFSAGSFQDMTRVAKLNEMMWSELFLENADYLVEETDCLIEKLKEFRRCIADGDRETLEQMLRTGRERKEQLMTQTQHSRIKAERWK